MLRNHITNPTSFLRGLLATIILILPWQSVYLFQVPVINGSLWHGGIQSLYLSELLVWIATPVFLFWYFHVHHKRHHKKHWSLTTDRLLMLSILMVVVYSLLTGIFSFFPSLALQHTNRIMAAAIFAIMITLGPLGWIDMIIMLVASAVVPSLLGIVQVFTQSTIGSTLLGLSIYHPDVPGTSIVASDSIGRFLRAYGSFPHPNVFGGFLVIALIAAFAAQSHLHSAQKQRRRLLHASIIIMSVALVGSMSRTAWIGALFAVGCGVVLTRSADKRWQVVHAKHLISALTLMIISVLFMLITFFPIITTRLSAQSSHEITSITERISNLEDATAMISLWPMYGVGAGNYTAGLLYLYPRRPVWMIAPIHNVPLLVVTEFGIVGTLLFVATIIMWLLYIMLLRVHSKHDTTLALVLAGITILPFLLFDHYLYTTPFGLLLTGLAVGLLTRSLIREN